MCLVVSSVCIIIMKVRLLKTSFGVFFLAALTVTTAVAEENNLTKTPATMSGASGTYVIGPGDNLQVFVWRSPELSITVPVRPDGRITTPLVEEMVASGKTPAVLARDMEEVLAEYIRSPKVNIIITDPQGLMSDVKIVGQVVTPQSVPYRDGLTALDMVLAVGGLTEFAAGNRAKIIRQIDGKSTTIRLRLNDLINKGHMHKDVELLPGDVVVVPQSLF